MQIDTERLVIRGFRPDDFDDLFEILGDSETMRFLEPAYSPEKTRNFLNDFCIRREPQAAYAVELRDIKKVIGYLLLNEPDEESIYEAGWIFNRTYWHRGYAHESLMALFEYAFAELSVHKVWAGTIDPEKSVNLMRRLGMQQEGVQRQQTRDLAGNWADTHLYGILSPTASGALLTLNPV